MKKSNFIPPSGTNRFIEYIDDRIPDQVRIFTLNLENNSGQFAPHYTKSGIQGVKSWAEAEECIRKAADGIGGQLPNEGDARPDCSKAAFPRHSISLNSPRQIVEAGHNFPESHSCLYVFKIADKTQRWRFSTLYSPFSTEWSRRWKKEDKFGPIYSHACFLYPRSTLESIRKYPDLDERELGSGYEPTAWACFLFDHERSNKAVMPGDNKRFRFNFHLEVEEHGGGPFLPITIDPDVGHPGGNQPGP